MISTNSQFLPVELSQKPLLYEKVSTSPLVERLNRASPMLEVSYIVGLGIDFAFAQIRHHEVNEGFMRWKN